MKEIIIKAPEGCEIDIENSDISKGIVVFKKVNELPESWEELEVISGTWVTQDSETNHNDNFNPISIHRNIWPTTKEAKASVALAQLCQLRDRYNGEILEDWCDWSNDDYKYTIIFYKNQIERSGASQREGVLAFKTEELRDKFLACPKIVELIEIAKPLL